MTGRMAHAGGVTPALGRAGGGVRAGGELGRIRATLRPVPRVPHSTDDLEAAELELQRALLHADVFSLEALFDDEAEWAWPDGTIQSKDEFLERYRSGRLRTESFEVERSRVRVIEELGLTDLVATVAGLDEGAPFEMRLRFQRTWKLADGWTVVSAHASVVRPGRLPPPLRRP